MDLTELADILKKQAEANSTIVLDASIFSSSTLDEIRTAFALETGANLTISDVKPADIPTPSAGLLEISAGNAPVLNIAGVGIDLAFTARDGSIDAVIVATMPASWRFSDSFSDLDVFPFQTLKTANARFVFATTAQTAYGWPGDSSYTIALQQGLNFISDITLADFALIVSLLKNLIKAPTYKFYGPFTPATGPQLPVGSLQAPVETGSFEVGVAPNSLALSAPSVVVRISPAATNSPLQEIDLFVEADFQKSLRVDVGIPRSGGTLSIAATPLGDQSSIKDVIEMLPGGKDFTSYIPAELSNIFSKIELDNFSMIVDPTPKVTYLSLSIGTSEPWTVIPPDVLVLEGLVLKIQTVDPGDSSWTQVSIAGTSKFLPKIFKGEFNFTVGLEKPTSWEVDTVSGSYYGLVSLADIVGGLLSTHDSIPSQLREIQFSDFGVSATRSSKEAAFSYSLHASAEAAFPILGRELTARLNLAVTKTATSYDIRLSGAFVIGEEEFAFDLDLGTADSKLSASWTKTGDPLEFGDIAAALGWNSMPAPPENLNLSLTDAEFIYDFNAETLALSAHSVNYGQLVFASMKSQAGDRLYVFALELPGDAELNNLPVVGDKLPANVGIKDFQLIVSSSEASEQDVVALNTLLGKSSGAGQLVTERLDPGPTLAATLHVLSEQQRLVIALEGSAASPDASTADRKILGAADGSFAPQAVATYQSSAEWFTVGKTFGPFSFRRIGVQYQDSLLSFLFDAALSAGGLTLSFDGLAISSPLTKFSPQFNLRGLGVDYSNGDVEISGAFLKMGVKRDGQEYEEYDGGAIIKTSKLNLSAIGSYAQLNGHESLFVYGVLNYPFGGPAFFFVTGLAAGFGYNRALIVPPIEEVAQFPLVAEAVAGSGTPNDLLTELTSLQQYIPPVIGDSFLAVGVKFTSFKMIDSFAVLAFVFGGQFEIDVLGLSTLIVPTPEGESVTPLAEVQMAIRATFLPEQGFLGVSAQLTSASYVLSRDCHLTGGFAFYSWFKGEHAGDFVQTLGGYHPNFKVPDHYPKVPRLALNWRVDDHVTIKGDLYYALTGSLLMAGGSLQAVWEDGDLKAWFNAGADFLIAWKPYHYDARIYVDMGVSHTFSFFGRHTISVDVGADLHVWGPEFSGTAHIHLWIVSFDVSFGGSSSQSPQPIEWPTFKNSFLPETVCSIAVQRGLVKKLPDSFVPKDVINLGIINPKELVLVTDSVVPSTATNVKFSSQIGAIGIGSMAVGANEIISTHTIVIQQVQLDASGNSIQPDQRDASHDFAFQQILKRVPAGLWGESLLPTLNGGDFIDGALSGFAISPVKKPISSETQQIPVKELRDSDPDVFNNAYNWKSLPPINHARK